MIEELKSYNYNNTNFFSLDGISTFCRIVDVLDGDTITVIIPLHNTFYKFIIRLYGIDTCEIKSKNTNIHQKGIDAKNRILSLLCSSNNLKDIDFNSTNFTRKEIKEFFNENFVTAYISCKDFDKFGRTLADVFLLNESESDKEKKQNDFIYKENSLSYILVNEKLAYPYFGDSKLSDEEIKKYFDLN